MKGDLAKLFIQEPGAFALIGAFRRSVVTQVKDLPILGANAEIILSHPPRSAALGDLGMLGLHITRHPATPLVIVPFAQQFGHAKFGPAPGEPVGTAWFFLQRGRLDKMDFDGLANEMDGFHGINSTIPNKIDRSIWKTLLWITSLLHIIDM
jgi:hypothetical protein